jgi:hypothetical protein
MHRLPIACVADACCFYLKIQTREKHNQFFETQSYFPRIKKERE